MKKLFVTLLAALSFVVANAQESTFAPYWFVNARGGLSMPHEADYSNIFYRAPTASFSIGKMLRPEIGFRINANRDFPSAVQEETLLPESPYCFDKFTVDVDGIFNLSTIFGKKDEYAFNVYMLAGLGKDHLGGGLMAEYNIAPCLSVTAETTLNSHQVWKAQLGISFKFGKKKAKPVVIEEPVIVPEPVVEPAPVVVEEPAPAPAPAPAPVVVPALKETIFYALATSDLDNEDVINKVVDWCNKYEDRNIVVSGYADKNTGNAKLNAKYAEERATKVADRIKNKGIDASRITVQSFGDTVQPYAENDLNRVVIIEGK